MNPLVLSWGLSRCIEFWKAIHNFIFYIVGIDIIFIGDGTFLNIVATLIAADKMIIFESNETFFTLWTEHRRLHVYNFYFIKICSI